MALTRDSVVSVLRTIIEPQLKQDIVALNMVKEVRLDGDKVHLKIELTSPNSPLKQTIVRQVETLLAQAGAAGVELQLSAKTAAPQHHPQSQRRESLPQVKNIIAVGAGKGGVGKSTVAVNLAMALHRQGAKVGVMDGDIYGPSMPTLLGLKGKAPQVRANKILPFQVHGLHAITIGALVEQEKPLIWRGPMAHGAFKQLLLDNTEWPELDYIVVDLPPGTGDVPLTLCQLLPLTGAVIVATPQQVALDDAIRAARMFQQLGAPILGVIENMSVFIAPDGSEHDIFGRGGAERTAQRLNLPFLGSLPMFPELRINSDNGDPEANFSSNPRLRDALDELGRNLQNQITVHRLQTPAPSLSVT